MDRSQYPALTNSGAIHLDASAVFPLHEDVIAAANTSMQHLLGAPGKARYESATRVAAEEAAIRQHIADFIHAEEEEIFLVASASDAARRIAELWATKATVLYSPEDHSRIVFEITQRSHKTVPLAYKANGEYDYESVYGSHADIVVLSHVHHIYGSDNNLAKIRATLPDAKIIVDASQSASRIALDVTKMGCDALFFSSQKLGGVAGVGVLYIAKKHHLQSDLKYLEPNTIPMIPLISLDAAMTVLETTTIVKINRRLAKLTASLIGELQRNPLIEFTKGPAFPDCRCYGHGIVSFSIDGYSSQDVAMILADSNIQVRSGDHCVDPSATSQNVTRISMHMFTTDEEIKKLTSILINL